MMIIPATLVHPSISLKKPTPNRQIKNKTPANIIPPINWKMKVEINLKVLFLLNPAFIKKIIKAGIIITSDHQPKTKIRINTAIKTTTPVIIQETFFFFSIVSSIYFNIKQYHTSQKKSSILKQTKKELPCSTTNHQLLTIL